MNNSARKVPLGIYEKAFPAEYSWEQILSSAKLAGYDFVEMSIDETSMRLDRLYWSHSERESLRKLIFDTGVPIWGMGISAHRKFPLGSASPELRQKGFEILQRSIEFSGDLGIRVIQIMGYDAIYEPSNADTQARYLEALYTSVKWASAAGVTLALENGDHVLVDSVEKAMRFVNAINSPWFQVYPDIGNMTAAGYSPLEQLPLAVGHNVGVHVKDTRPGEYRGVLIGQGTVQIQESLSLLAQMGFTGPLEMELWSHLDPNNDPIGSLTHSREILDGWISDAWGV